MNKIPSLLDSKALKVFVQVADSQNLTEAAQVLGLTPSAVSKAVARLEEVVGVRLLTRNARLVSLTPEGKLLNQHARQIVGALESARNAVCNSRDVPQGSVRLSMPVGLGHEIVLPHIGHFRAAHPHIAIELIFTNRRLNFDDGQIDVALWYGALPDSSLIARSVGMLYPITCAAPDYIARFGRPEAPDDLKAHRLLGLLSESSGNVSPWQFSHGGIEVNHVPTPCILSNSSQAITRLCEAAEGIAQLTEHFIVEDLRNGLLEPILTEFNSRQGTQLLLVHQHKHPSRRVRLFIDYLIGALRKSLSETSPLKASATRSQISALVSQR